MDLVVVSLAIARRTVDQKRIGETFDGYSEYI